SFAVSRVAATLSAATTATAPNPANARRLNRARLASRRDPRVVAGPSDTRRVWQIADAESGILTPSAGMPMVDLTSRSGTFYPLKGTSSMRRILAASFAALSLSLVMGACSSDSKKVADLVQSDVKKETSVQDVKVTCPSNLEAKKGNKGVCSATGDFTAFLTTKGYDLTGKQATEIKYNVEFTDDTTVSIAPDNADLQTRYGGGTSSSTADSTSSVDTSSSSSTSP
ncbi:MAG: hypothetical protein QOG39_1609, partial [Acidimicrobiaceae bacterium]